MATNQWSRTALIAQARIYCQDDDASSNYAVSDTKAGSLLTPVVSRWIQNVLQRPVYANASTTGLSFSAGDYTKVMTADLNYEEFADAFQVADNSTLYAVTPPLERKSVNFIREMYNLQPGDTPPQSGTTWQLWGAEKVGNATDDWRIWVYPALSVAAYLTVLVNTSDATATTPDIPYEHGDYVSRYLAFEMGRLKKEASREWLNGIIEPIPVKFQTMYGGEAIHDQQRQDCVIERRS